MEKLKCSKCGEEKELEHFNKRNNTKRGYSHWCKKCYNFYDKSRYKKEKKKIVGQKKKRKHLIREWFEEYKSFLKCEHCGENHPACFDFHHLDGSEKDDCISVLVGGGYAVKRIKEEIDKCIVLCANCHRKLHYEEKIRALG